MLASQASIRFPSLHGSPLPEKQPPLQAKIVHQLPSVLTQDRMTAYRNEMLDFDALSGFVSSSSSSEPLDAHGGIRALNLAVYTAMKTAHTPVPDIDVLSHTSGQSFPALGSDDWYRQAQSSGVYIPLPTNIEYLFGSTALKHDNYLKNFLATYRTESAKAKSRGETLRLEKYKEDYKTQRGKSQDKDKRLFQKDGMGDHEAHTFRALCAFVDAVIEINEHLNRLHANGASKEQLSWIARRLTRPTATLSPGSEVDDRHFGDFMKTLGKEEEIFSVVYNIIHLRPSNAKIFDEFKGSASMVAASLLAERGVSLLQQQAEELNLELFEDSEQVKVDINLAIIQATKSMQRDMMSWTTEERLAFNLYTDNLRSASFSHPKEILDQFEKQYPDVNQDHLVSPLLTTSTIGTNSALSFGLSLFCPDGHLGPVNLPPLHQVKRMP